jgi:hypothetical protein
MDRPVSRPTISSNLVAGSFLLAMSFAATGVVRAQTSGQGGSTNSRSQGAGPSGGVDRRGANPAPGTAQKAEQPRNEPSQAYRESIRRTVEKRRQRRVKRQQAMGDSSPIGGIGMWPMPPALIIRQTPQVHDEIETLLGVLRR